MLLNEGNMCLESWNEKKGENRIEIGTVVQELVVQAPPDRVRKKQKKRFFANFFLQ